MKSIEKLFSDKTKVFRLWVYKKMFTPYELENKFMDESIYEGIGHYVCITEFYELPDGDILLGVREVYDKESYEFPEEKWIIDYYKFNEIRLMHDPDDLERIINDDL